MNQLILQYVQYCVDGEPLPLKYVPLFHFAGSVSIAERVEYAVRKLSSKDVGAN